MSKKKSAVKKTVRKTAKKKSAYKIFKVELSNSYKSYSQTVRAKSKELAIVITMRSFSVDNRLFTPNEVKVTICKPVKFDENEANDDDDYDF